MEKVQAHASWINRNDWVLPLFGSATLMFAMLVHSTLLNGTGIVLPGWLLIAGNAGACFGLFWGALKARLSSTVSAQILCSLALIAGIVVAIWQVIEILRR
ncbi:hypothetical protein [Paraburkholderia sp. J8-2]|uniref:hypothetical protein n=1 Tax=Paraburkholderia sp. J8-2 TaxID=2805440 RepID=UPI002AB7D4F5|nr:hypothetical protein [Paraburkholderia sp. J8-2]